MSVHLVTGDDERLVADATLTLVGELVGDGDRALLVDEFSGDDLDPGLVADAARTPPFLTDRRVVVARRIDGCTAGQLAPLVEYLADPSDTTDLVIEHCGRTVPKALADAVKQAKGNRVATAAPQQARAQKGWIAEQIDTAGLSLEPGAVALLTDRVGEDLGRVPGVLLTLAGVYGAAERRLTVTDVEPYLGDEGGVPPWDLTDPIDQGDIAAALAAVQRMVEGADRAPIQVMASLVGHFDRMLRLDGSGVADDAAAAKLLGDRGKSTFRARKSLAQARRLGSTRLAEAYRLLADADVDLRGRSGLDARHVLEVLVARLAQLSGRRAGAR